MRDINRRKLLTGATITAAMLNSDYAKAAMPESMPAAPPHPYGEFRDVRQIIGGDGEVGPALMNLRKDGFSAWIPAGSYSLSGEFDQGDMLIRASSAAKICSVGDGSTMFRSAGTFNSLPALRSSLRKGALEMHFQSIHDLQPGDWLVIYDPADFSWHESRHYYRAGEWCQVAVVTRHKIALTKPLRSGYHKSAVQVFRVTLRRPALEGGFWDCGSKELVHYSACTGQLVNVDDITAAANTAIYIDRCVDAEVRCKEGRNRGAGLDDYLICVGNSQHIRVYGRRLQSRRHPIAIGGGDLPCGVPSRDCSVIGAMLENDLRSNVMCADIHGNAADCTYADCRIIGGISLGGANPAYRNCTIYARLDGTAAEATELVGGTIDLADIHIVTAAVHIGGGRGLIDIGTQNGSFNRATRMDVTISLSNFSVDAPALAADEAIIRIRNNGSKARLNVRARRGGLQLTQPVQFLRTEHAFGKKYNKLIEIKDIYGLPIGSQLHYRAEES